MGEAAKKLPITLEEWIALEQESDERHELVDGELWVMSGSSTPHNKIGRQHRENAVACRGAGMSHPRY